MVLFTPPLLSDWLANLAGILPLSAVIEFTDPPKTLHAYELCGRGMLWNWIVTPAGARLLLSARNIATACCLDEPGAIPSLHCIDCKWGNMYPCSAPFTIRTCIPLVKTVYSQSGFPENPIESRNRQQHLEIIRVSLCKTPAQYDSQVTPPQEKALPLGTSQIGNGGGRWLFIAVAGWILWTGVLLASALYGLYIAMAYLIVLSLTGLTIRYSHGHTTRMILDARSRPDARMVLVCESLNGNEWTAFIGEGNLVTSILNKPLYKVHPTPYPKAVRIITRTLVVIQWTLTAVACAFQDWNAIMISVWIAVCAVTSTYMYSESSAVEDWLRTNGIHLEKARVSCSTRRTMISTLVAINPDRECTSFIDPILPRSESRTEWEDALLEYLKNGPYPTEVESQIGHITLM